MTNSELREYNHILRWGNKSEIMEFQKRMKATHDFPESFSDFMYEMIKKTGRTKAMIAQRAGLSREYVYKVLNSNSGKRTTERDYILALCIAADMSLIEVQKALSLYPFPILDDSDDRAAVIISAFLTHTKIDDLNAMLENAGYEPLRTSPEMKKSPIGPVRSTDSVRKTVSSNHDEELIASVIRRMHMKKNSEIDVWEGNLGPGTMSAEMKFIDNDGIEKFAQINTTWEVSSFSVSRKSLHDYDPVDDDKCWTSETCEDYYDTFEIEDMYYEMFGATNGCDESAEDSEELDNYTMLLRVSSRSKYYSMYLKLDAALDEYIEGPGIELEIEREKNELIGAFNGYKVILEWETSNGNKLTTNRKEIGVFSDVDKAVEVAKKECNSPSEENDGYYSVTVENEDEIILWRNGYKY